MDEYVCAPASIPRELYRVHYPESRTTRDRSSGLLAANTRRVFAADQQVEFKQAIEDQFTWGCRKELPFISLFSDREHAENWALREPWRQGKPSDRSWSLYVIDAEKLSGTNRIFKLSHLVDELDLEIPDGAQQHVEGAFLCLHSVPCEAVIELLTPKQVEEDREARRMDIHEVDHDFYHGMYGYEPEDLEMLQDNINGNIERAIEDSWSLH